MKPAAPAASSEDHREAAAPASKLRATGSCSSPSLRFLPSSSPANSSGTRASEPADPAGDNNNNQQQLRVKTTIEQPHETPAKPEVL
ncbi:hypothetical protein KY289_008093 [Solanum tuberosum]|nr:hypothetical protein KY289_008093 [Solanum tuberosum]